MELLPEAAGRSYCTVAPTVGNSSASGLGLPSCISNRLTEERATLPKLTSIFVVRQREVKQESQKREAWGGGSDSADAWGPPTQGTPAHIVRLAARR